MVRAVGSKPRSLEFDSHFQQIIVSIDTHVKTNHAIKMLVFKNKTEAELEQGFELKTATIFFIQKWKNADGAAFFTRNGSWASSSIFVTC